MLSKFLLLYARVGVNSVSMVIAFRKPFFPSPSFTPAAEDSLRDPWKAAPRAEFQNGSHGHPLHEKASWHKFSEATHLERPALG